MTKQKSFTTGVASTPYKSIVFYVRAHRFWQSIKLSKSCCVTKQSFSSQILSSPSTFVPHKSRSCTWHRSSSSHKSVRTNRSPKGRDLFPLRDARTRNTSPSRPRRGNKSKICAEEGVARTCAPKVREGARFVRNEGARCTNDFSCTDVQPKGCAYAQHRR